MTLHLLFDVAPESFPIPMRSIAHFAVGTLALLGAIGLGVAWLALRKKSPERASSIGRAAGVSLGVYVMVVLLNALVHYPERRPQRPYPPPPPAPAASAS